ncbi:MAG: hypothetical protein QM639_02770 [Rhodocyclaceae bacterium]
MKFASVAAIFAVSLVSAPVWAGSLASSDGSFAQASAAATVHERIAQVGAVRPVSVSFNGSVANGQLATSRYAGEATLIPAALETRSAGSIQSPAQRGLFASVLAGLGMVLFTVLRRLNN